MRIPTRITQMSVFPHDLTGPPSLAAVSLQGAPRVSSVPLIHLSQVCGGSGVSHPTFLLFLSEVCVWGGRRTYVYYILCQRTKRHGRIINSRKIKLKELNHSAPLPSFAHSSHTMKRALTTPSAHTRPGTRSLAQHLKAGTQGALPGKHSGSSSK